VYAPWRADFIIFIANIQKIEYNLIMSITPPPPWVLVKSNRQFIVSFLLLISIVLLILTTCKNFAPGGGGDYDPDGITYTGVTYSPDGRSVTIYLDGTTVPMTNRQARGLSRELAIQGHDYFEVAFLYRVSSDPNGDIIARASWELMKDAHVSGVYGKGKGDTQNINYQAVVRPASDGLGAAILFVGKKTDKTLLGVGRLSHVDGNPGYEINSGSKSVTFTVDALKSGVVGERLPTLPTSSFMTSFGDTVSPERNVINEANTRGIGGNGFYSNFQLGNIGVGFPLFKLREDGHDTYAQYEFFTASGGSFNTPTSLNTFGIILAGLGNYEKRQPRYPTQDGRFQYFSVILDNTTQIDAVYNNLAIGSTFQNPVQVAFNPVATEKGSMFAFAFEVPVCPLSTISSPGKPAPGIWYMRPSYDSYWWDLDDGRGAGGAVLIGYGDVKEVLDYKIKVVKPPDKIIYSDNPLGPNTPNNRVFNPAGLVVELLNSENEHIKYLLNPDEFSYEIGEIGISHLSSPPGVISTTLYGIQYVDVSYIYNSVIYRDFFMIIADDAGYNYSATIPPRHYIVIDSNVADPVQDRISNRLNYANQAGRPTNVFVIIADRNFNQHAVNLQDQNGPFVIIVVAGSASTEPNGTYDSGLDNSSGVGNRVIGRNNGNGATYDDEARQFGAFRVYSRVTGTTRSANAFYFGIWPFNTPLVAYNGAETNWLAPNGANLRTYSHYAPLNRGGTTVDNVHKTYPYIINAAGPYQAVLTASPPYTGDPPPADPRPPTTGGSPYSAPDHSYYLHEGFGGTVNRVQVDQDVRVKNREYLY
jgi:hypothetical protein